MDLLGLLGQKARKVVRVQLARRDPPDHKARKEMPGRSARLAPKEYKGFKAQPVQLDQLDQLAHWAIQALLAPLASKVMLDLRGRRDFKACRERRA